jgi:hypothetical protein
MTPMNYESITSNWHSFLDECTEYSFSLESHVSNHLGCPEKTNSNLVSNSAARISYFSKDFMGH